LPRNERPLPVNPFSFGALVLDEAFTDREVELAQILSTMRSGQDLLVYAPRRYGKSSLVLRAAQEAAAEGILVGYCDLFRVTTKETLAAALAKTIHADIDAQTFERAAALFRDLRIRPTMEFDTEHGSLAFSFRTTTRKTDIDATIESLLELLGKLAAERQRRVVMIFDEFQEIVDVDERLPNLLRSVFQAQSEVCHMYLGSKQHVLDRIFDDQNEQFWRSAKRLEIGIIESSKFAPFIRARFQNTEKGITDSALARLLDATGSHPYATQELAFEVWDAVQPEKLAHDVEVEAALERVLRSENNHLEKLWEDATAAQRQLLIALATEPTSTPYAEDYRSAFDLPATSTVQAARVGLERKEIVGSRDGVLKIIEPFLADWIKREQKPPPFSAQLRLDSS
jgi:AAA+ ATPase superfamily predicted ATPase